jgi:hypothetical protein
MRSAPRTWNGHLRETGPNIQPFALGSFGDGCQLLVHRGRAAPNRRTGKAERPLPKLITAILEELDKATR